MKSYNLVEILFVALIAHIGEFIMGWIIKFVTGEFLWIYPDSFLVTTSVYAYPLWVVLLIIIRQIAKSVMASSHQ